MARTLNPPVPVGKAKKSNAGGGAKRRSAPVPVLEWGAQPPPAVGFDAPVELLSARPMLPAGALATTREGACAPPVRPPQTAIGRVLADGHQLELCRGARPVPVAVFGVAPFHPPIGLVKKRQRRPVSPVFVKKRHFLPFCRLFGRREAWIIAFPRRVIAFPRRIIAFPRRVIAFPRGIIAFPRGIIAFPRRVIAFPRGIIAFPRRVIAFPRGIITFIPTVIAFPRRVIAFTRQVIAFARPANGFARREIRFARPADGVARGAIPVRSGCRW